MLRKITDVLEKKPIKVALVLFCAVATVVLAPMAALGLYMMGLYLTSLAFVSAEARDLQSMVSFGLLGAGGLVGLVGAWISILLPREQLRESSILRVSTIAALAIGIATAAFLIVDTGLRNPTVVSLFLVSGTIGLVLLIGTIGKTKEAPT